MTISKSHYHRSRLLRDRRKKDEARHQHAPSSEEQTMEGDDFDLPEYLLEAAKSAPPVDESRLPPVILWDEVA